MKRFAPFLLLFFCVSLFAAEDTGYRIVHPDGTVEFTDDSTRGGEEIKLRDVQVVDKPENEGEHRRPKEQPLEKKEKASGYTSLRILSPRAEETVWFSENGITVSVAATPSLNPDDTVVIYLDGVAASRAKRTSQNIGLVYRGTHTLSANIVDATGKTVISSPAVTFFLHQHSN
jgi:hypothetical protein